MQPIGNTGSSSLATEKALDNTLTKTAPPADDSPLTLAQRTSLEKLVMQVATLSGANPAEIWATLRAELGAKNNAELRASQFTAAEQGLQNRLSGAQGAQDTRQLLQQLTGLLAQGNNRQAASDFIRQQFGHTVLSSLTPSQLRLVVTLLQNGSLPQASTLVSGTPLADSRNALTGNTGPATGVSNPLLPLETLTNGTSPAGTQSASLLPPPLPQNLQQLAAGLQNSALPDARYSTQSAASGRVLLPAEHNLLNQQVARLVALTGESPAKVWQTLMAMQGLKTGEPMPAKNFQTLSQFLTTQSFLLQQHTPQTLHNIQAALKHPADPQEQQLLQDFTRTLSITPQAPLTPTQMTEVVTFLYRRRLQQLQDSAATPAQPFINPLIAALPFEWHKFATKPIGLALSALLIVALLLWILL
ncbi:MULTISPECIES: cell division protein [Dickeya]|uniref:Flagellar assembly regulatory protein, Flk n=1 Tax=Dickeya aquatica TaxID=1401087 RepID=A0A375A8E3_9GAMM|nr:MULTISPECIES: cell division protein [Dickeya]SLM62315.1 Putative flagellar assembly regulatory protein, Flk [Dickeya aquatica]